MFIGVKETVHRSFTHLSRENDERYANHDDHVELGRPDVRHEVTVSDGGKSHYHVVSGLEKT